MAEDHDRTQNRRENWREPQDRARDEKTTQGQAESPVDRMDVESPGKKDNEHGHRRIPQRDQTGGHDV